MEQSSLVQLDRPNLLCHQEENRKYYTIVSLRRNPSQKKYLPKTFVSKVTHYTLEKFKEAKDFHSEDFVNRRNFRCTTHS